jgi:hypothetical protein
MNNLPRTKDYKKAQEKAQEKAQVNARIIVCINQTKRDE